MDVWTHPSWHFSDEAVKPLAQTRAPGGRTYAVVCSMLLGRPDLFLVSTDTPEDNRSWSRPSLIPAKLFRSIRDPSLTAKGDDALVFSFVQEKPAPRGIMEGTPDPGKEAPALGLQELEIRISEVRRDGDRDGWTDLEEARLGLDQSKEDTDGDGIADGRDPCPNFVPSAGHETNEGVRVLQKAVFATFGLTDSRYLLLVGPESAKVQVWGYRGPIVYLNDPAQWRAEHGYGAAFVTWQVSLKGNEATVSIHDYEGPLAAGSQSVHLRRIGNDWIVIKRKFGGVS